MDKYLKRGNLKGEVSQVAQMFQEFRTSLNSFSSALAKPAELFKGAILHVSTQSRKNLEPITDVTPIVTADAHEQISSEQELPGRTQKGHRCCKSKGRNGSSSNQESLQTNSSRRKLALAQLDEERDSALQPWDQNTRYILGNILQECGGLGCRNQNNCL